MKVFQTVYTSAVSTLDDRQGLGLVYSSVDLPEVIKGILSRFGYDREAGGAPIFSFERFEAGDCFWLVLNRTVPAVDYTGRTSCVSHTLAIKENDLHAHCGGLPGPFPTVFEFMRDFAWKSSWEGNPRWETDGEILTIVNALNQNVLSEWDNTRPRSNVALLAFETVDDKVPQPKRVAWQLPGKTPEEILDFFSQTWSCLDPWRGVSKFKGILDEPDFSRLSSWSCTFATNLRNNRPDPYQWVVLSPKVPQLPGREVLEPGKWSDEDPAEIKRQLSVKGISDLIVERIEEGPRNWARRRLERKLQDLSQQYDEEIRAQNDGTSHALGELISQLNSAVEECTSQFGEVRKEYSQMYGVGVDLATSLEQQFAYHKDMAESRSRDLLDDYHQKSSPIRTLLSIASRDGERSTLPTPLFEEETVSFKGLCGKWREIVPVVKSYNAYKKFYEDTIRKFEQSQEELQQTKSELQLKESETLDLKASLRTMEQSKRWTEDREAELVREQNKLKKELESLREIPSTDSQPQDSAGKSPKSKPALARPWMWAFFAVSALLCVMSVLFLVQLNSLRKGVNQQSDDGAREVEPAGGRKAEIAASREKPVTEPVPSSQVNTEGGSAERPTQKPTTPAVGTSTPKKEPVTGGDPKAIPKSQPVPDQPTESVADQPHSSPK
jgi:hypothetical protein